MHYIKLKDEYIKLGQALKVEGLADSGANAKNIIVEGKVKVNGVIEYKRGKKLYNGDLVEAKNEQIKIIK